MIILSVGIPLLSVIIFLMHENLQLVCAQYMIDLFWDNASHTLEIMYSIIYNAYVLYI